MIRLMFVDLRDHATTWLGAFFVAVACGYIGGWAASFVETANYYTGDVSRALEGSALIVILFSVVVAIVVLSSAANLTVSVNRRSYALWQLMNVSPIRVSAVVLAQLAVVATTGAVGGTLLVAVTIDPLFPLVFNSYGPTFQLVPRVGVIPMSLVCLSVVGVFLFGGMKGARSAGHTPPLVALREPELRRIEMTRLRIVLFIALSACSGILVSNMGSSEPFDAMDDTLYLLILIAAVVASVAPFLLSLTQRVWTSFAPEDRWDAWFLARRTARYGLSVSTSVETPIMLGFLLVGGTFSLLNAMGLFVQQEGIIGMSTTLDGTSAILLMGGPVLLCAVGAAASVLMSSQSRTRDIALLVASGAGRETLIAAAVYEALIHAVTATLVGMVGVVVFDALVSCAIRLPLFSGLTFTEGFVVSVVGFFLVLIATLVPTCAALNEETAIVLSV